MRMNVAACKSWWQHRRVTALKPSGLDLVPGIRLRVIDANLQRRKAAFQFDGTGFSTFSGVEFGLIRPSISMANHAFGSSLERSAMSDVPRCIGNAMSYCESGFPAQERLTGRS
jgi:hypothetical protein